MAGFDPAIQQPHENASYSLLHGWPGQAGPRQRVLHLLGAANKRPEIRSKLATSGKRRLNRQTKDELISAANGRQVLTELY
jgi:hypothetical protein